MASGPKPSSAHTHNTCLAHCGSTTVPNRPGQRGPLLAWPAVGHGPRPHAARARCGALRAHAVTRLTVANWSPNLGMVYTASFPSPWCIRLKWLRAPAQSEEGGRRRGGTHRRGRWRRSSTMVKVSPSWFGK
jgi:hypothetical protein